MDAPKCPLCGKRHWSRQSCAAATERAAANMGVKSATAKAVPTAAKSATKKQRPGSDPPVTLPKATPVTLQPYPDCPVCAARREKIRKRVRRYRARKAKP